MRENKEDIREIGGVTEQREVIGEQGRKKGYS
jgi:hypothetical protein